MKYDNYIIITIRIIRIFDRDQSTVSKIEKRDALSMRVFLLLKANIKGRFISTIKSKKFAKICPFSVIYANFMQMTCPDIRNQLLLVSNL